jgi:hypothetical protein
MTWNELKNSVDEKIKKSNIKGSVNIQFVDIENTDSQNLEVSFNPERQSITITSSNT